MLIPSLYREGNYFSREQEMLGELERRCPKEFYSCKSIIQKLSHMQHYGLPTRLLDFTQNPLIALYFACEDGNGIGELISINVRKEQISYESEDENKNVEKAIRCTGNPSNKVLKIILADMIDVRLQSQLGCFAVFGDNGDMELSKMREEEESVKVCFILPKDKRSIIAELDLLGINEAFVYPEIEHVTKYIKQTIRR